MWKDADPLEVQSLWAAELSAYEATDIKSALAAMGHAYQDYPPTLYQFRQLCRDACRARSQSARKVEYVRYGGPSPEVLAAIHELTSDPAKRKRDPKDWARRVLQREADGEKLPLIAVRYAREALGIK